MPGPVMGKGGAIARSIVDASKQGSGAHRDQARLGQSCISPLKVPTTSFRRTGSAIHEAAETKGLVVFCCLSAAENLVSPV